MAKKNKNQNGMEGEEKAGSKIVSFLVVLIIIAVWIGVLILLVKLDVGGFGSSVLRPVLKDVPVINKILPPASDEEAAKETSLPYTTLQQALTRIEELEAENKELKKSLEDANTSIDEKQKEIERLLIFEQNQAEFERQKEAFYNEIVYGEKAPGADTYTEWYNSIDKENAERIYRQIVASQNANSAYSDLANTYASMKPTEAAKILEAMPKDIKTVAAILEAMSPEQRGAIMGKMSAEFAAKVTKVMRP